MPNTTLSDAAIARLSVARCYARLRVAGTSLAAVMSKIYNERSFTEEQREHLCDQLWSAKARWEQASTDLSAALDAIKQEEKNA